MISQRILCIVYKILWVSFGKKGSDGTVADEDEDEEEEEIGGKAGKRTA